MTEYDSKRIAYLYIEGKATPDQIKEKFKHIPPTEIDLLTGVIDLNRKKGEKPRVELIDDIKEKRAKAIALEKKRMNETLVKNVADLPIASHSLPEALGLGFLGIVMATINGLSENGDDASMDKATKRLVSISKAIKGGLSISESALTSGNGLNTFLGSLKV